MDNRSHKNSAGKSSSASNPREKNPSRKKRRVSTPVLVMRAIFLVLLVALTGVGICMVTVKPGDDEMNAYRDNGKFYDGISISGLDISGLTFDEAWDLVAPKVKQDLAAFNVTVRVDNRIWLLSANDIGVTVTLEQVLMEAMSLGRGDTAVNNLAEKNNLAQEGASFTVGYQLSDESKLRGVIEGIAELVDTAPIDAVARPIRTSSEPSFDYVEGERGRRLNVDDIVSDIKTAISESNAPVEVSPEFEYVEPELTVDDLKGLTELRATYQTSYGTSSTPVSYTHLDVYKRQAHASARCNFGRTCRPKLRILMIASGGLEPITAIGGSQNGLLRFVSFSACVRSPLTHPQGVILAVHAAQNYGFKNCLRRLRTFFAKKVLRTPKNAQGIIYALEYHPNITIHQKSAACTAIFDTLGANMA